jgi:hypothetical protein
VHLFVNVYRIDDLPTEKADLDKWLRDVFFKKEVILQDFYAQLNRDGHYAHHEKVSNEVYQQLDPTLQNIARTTNIPKPITAMTKVPSNAVAIIATMVIFCITLLAISSWTRWLCTCFVIFAVAAKFANGFDSLELALHCDMVLASSAIPFHASHSNSNPGLSKLVDSQKNK